MPSLSALGTLNAKDWSADTITSYLNKQYLQVEKLEQDKEKVIEKSDN
jgi:hypothetical protein